MSRIQWTDREWDEVFTLIDPASLTTRHLITHEVFEKQGILPKDRWRTEVSIMTSRRLMETRWREWSQAKALVENKLEPIPPTHSGGVEPVHSAGVSTDALTEAVWSVFAPRLRQLVREEIALGLLGRRDQANIIEKRVEHLKEATTPAATRDLIKVDVVGLLSSQAQQVESSDIGQRMDIRFIDAEKSAATKYRENVVIVTKFVSHYSQEAAKAQGCRIVYANGAAGSVIAALERLFVELADIP